MTLEEIKDKALVLIEKAANGVNIKHEASELVNERTALDAKFQKGDDVWVLDIDYVFMNAEVHSIYRTDEGYFYWLHENTGRILGKYPESMIFLTKDDLRDFLMSVCEKNK